MLTSLRVKGFGVSLRSFGAGGAAPEQLRGLPLTEVRLARALVTGASGDPGRAATLEEVVQAGRELGVVIVGDGCDSEDDLRLLLTLGCDQVQGTFVAEAMPGGDVPAWAAAWDPDRLVVGDAR
jgi:EAL domain-containing protein (putative c-di-GMP-specific phosphodiesterase class I)